MNRNHQVILLSLVVSAVSSVTSVAAETEVGGSNSVAAQKLFTEALNKSNRGDNVGAIVDYTQALSIDSKYGKAYANRASVRFNVKDYKGAIADLDVALRYFPNMQFLLDLKQRAVNGMASNDSSGGAEAQRAAANQMLMRAVLGGGDFADPSTILMMRAGAGAAPRGPIVNPFAAHPLTSGQPVDLTPGVPKSPPGTTADDPSTANESKRLEAMANSIPAPGEESSQSQPGNRAGMNASALTEKDYFARGCKKSQALYFSGAIADFSETIKLDPKLPDAWANKGLARFHIKDYKGALEDFEQADRLLPNNKQLKDLIEQARKAANG